MNQRKRMVFILFAFLLTFVGCATKPENSSTDSPVTPTGSVSVTPQNPTQISTPIPSPTELPTTSLTPIPAPTELPTATPAPIEWTYVSKDNHSNNIVYNLLTDGTNYEAEVTGAFSGDIVIPPLKQ